MKKNIRFALPMSILEFTGVMNRDWEKIGKRIFNGKEQNEPKRTNRNHKQNIK